MSVEKNSLFDRITLILSFAFICAGIALFQYNPLSIIPLRDLQPIATISKLQFESKRKMPGTLSWLQAKKSDVLYQGDQILTDERSSVTVEFKGGSKLFISPQSLIKIETINDEYQIFLVKGELKLEGKEKLNIIDTQTGKKIKARDKIQVSSSALGLTTNEVPVEPIKEINILTIKQGESIDPNTNETIEFDFSQEHTGTVITSDASGKKVNNAEVSGNLNVTIGMLNPGRYTTTVFDTNKKVVGKASFRVEPYNSPMINPIPEDTIFTRGQPLVIQWSGIKNANYRLTVNSPSGRKQFEGKVNQFPITFKESGIHTIQVSMLVDRHEYASDEISLDVELQDGINIPSEQLNQTLAQGATANLTVKNLVNKDLMVLELSSTPDFSSKTSGAAISSGQNKVSMGTPGIRYLRVKTEGPNPIFSPIVKVTVTTLVATNANDYKQKQEISKGQEKATLAWINSSLVKKVKLQVASDEDFRNIVLAKETSATSETINKPVGTYYWRVLPLTNSPEYILPSGTKVLEIALPPIIEPQILAQQILEYYEDLNTSGYKIKLKPHVHAKQYLLEVYLEPSLKRKVFSQASPTPVIFWERVRSGKYFYRIKIEDHWGRMSDYSKVGELIFPISPMVDL